MTLPTMPAANAITQLPDKSGMRIGEVESLSPVVVLVQGGRVTAPGLLNGVSVAVGDTVALLRQDNTWLLLGTVESGA